MPKSEHPGGVAAKVETLVRPAVEALGLRLWDVRFDKEGSGWFLKVLIDRDTPLDTDTCEAASRAIDPLLDEADPIEQSYCLEVGSPGLGRKLCKPAHFTAWLGKKIAVKRYKADDEGRKELLGTLRGFDGKTLTLDLDDGAEVSLPLKEVANAKARDDEDLF